MPHIKHVHKPNCDRNDFTGYLCSNAPDFLWYCVQDVGSYQGKVYGVAMYQGKIAIYEDYYGSCAGCGAWGEGGEPTSQEEIVSKCTFFNDMKTAEEKLKELCEGCDEAPDVEKMKEAIREVLSDLNSSYGCNCIKEYKKPKSL